MAGRQSNLPTLLLIFLTLATQNSAHAASSCDLAFRDITPFSVELPPTYSNDPLIIDSTIRPTWNPDKLSNPHAHNPNDFMYIVRVGQVYSEWFNGRRIDPKAKMLERLQKPNYISASLIGRRPDGKEMLGTYLQGRTGQLFILKVPASQIHVAIPHDTGRLANSDQPDPGSATLMRDERVYGLFTPESMISETIRLAADRNRLDTHYNEILFVGSKEVEIIGIANFGQDIRSAEELSQRLGGVPVVQIK